jgi:TolB protein
MSSDGGDQRILVGTPHYDHSPAWSPEGESIVFMRQYPPVEGRPINNMEIVLVRADGTGFRRLTWSPYSDSEPTWASDGNSIVFVSDRSGSSEIYKMSLDGSGLTRLTEHPRGAGEFAGPAWGPTVSE